MSEISAQSGKALTRLAVALAQTEDLEAVLWVVAHEAIAQMDLEDCVIYVVDAERGVCVQRAAYGPKNPEGFEILQPIEIPVGEGIVGTVAATGAPVLVDDVSTDRRYILDDAQRASELAVPIIHDGAVIGVLDSEHSRPAFFTADHRDSFVAIAAIAANRFAAAVLQQQLLVARDAAAQAARSKRDFLLMIRHELRTPMNGIIGLSDLLLGEASDPRQLELLRELNQAGRGLMGLLDDVLTIADLGMDRVALRETAFSPAEAVESTCALFVTAAREKGLRLEQELGASLPAQVVGDAVRLRQVLLALMSNALKFTAHGSIRIGAESRDDGVCYWVRDTGIGIEEAAISSVFEPFVQRESGLTRTYGGAGLGLSVVRGLVERMGGRISVISKPAEGSEFTVWLPARVPV